MTTPARPALTPPTPSASPTPHPTATKQIPDSPASPRPASARTRTFAPSPTAHTAPAQRSPEPADASSPPAASMHVRRRTRLPSPSARRLTAALHRKAPPPAPTESRLPAQRTHVPVHPQLRPTYASIFFICCVHPPSFRRKASARRSAGTLSNPDSLNLSNVPVCVASSQNSTSVGISPS